MGLNPTALERVSRALRPDFTRTLRARRIAAAALVLVAAAAALRPDPGGADCEVTVAARDLSPGMILGATDVRTEKRSAATLPDGIQPLDRIIGSTLTGPARRGEILTDARLLGSRLAGLSAGRDARVVPVHLSDSAVLDVVRSGDVVDLLGAAQGAAGAETHPRLIAANAVVVMVSPAGSSPSRGEDRVVLVALPAAAATALAGATLTQSVTLTLH